jgi:CRP-like cAMP-binding protein
MNQENPIFHILEQIPLFSDLTHESYELIANDITLQYYPTNLNLFSKGDPGEAMYIIKKGSVKIYQGNQEDLDEQTKIAVLESGDFFGEMALVSETMRNANAITVGECEIFILKKDDFDRLISENPSLAEQISSEFIQRLRENDRNDLDI